MAEELKIGDDEEELLTRIEKITGVKSPRKPVMKPSPNPFDRPAQTLGIDPVDLATMVSFETAGTFDPNKRGGEGNNYVGAIQFGIPEQKKYYKPGQTLEEQLNDGVVRYFQDRFKQVGKTTQGATLEDLYTTVIAGNPDANRNAKDSFGTSALSGVQRMLKEHRPEVLKRFFGGVMPTQAQINALSKEDEELINRVSQITGGNEFKPEDTDLLNRVSQITGAKLPTTNPQNAITPQIVPTVGGEVPQDVVDANAKYLSQKPTIFDKQGNPVNVIGGEDVEAQITSTVAPIPVNPQNAVTPKVVTEVSPQIAPQVEQVAPTPQIPVAPSLPTDADYEEYKAYQIANKQPVVSKEEFNKLASNFGKNVEVQAQIASPKVELPQVVQNQQVEQVAETPIQTRPGADDLRESVYNDKSFTDIETNLIYKGEKNKESFDKFVRSEVEKNLLQSVPNATSADVEAVLSDSKLDNIYTPGIENSAITIPATLQSKVANARDQRIWTDKKTKEAEKLSLEKNIPIDEAAFAVGLLDYKGLEKSRADRAAQEEKDRPYREAYEKSFQPDDDEADQAFILSQGYVTPAQYTEQRKKDLQESIAETLKEYGSFESYYKERKAMWERIAKNPNSAATEFTKNLIRTVPKSVSSVLKAISIGSEILDTTVGQAGLLSNLTDTREAKDRGAYQLGKWLDQKVDEFLPQDKQLSKAFVLNTLPDALGQLFVQIGLGVATGGVSAPLLFGVASGGSEQYEEADRFKATRRNKLLASIVGGTAGIFDAIPMAKWLAPLNKAEKLGFFSKLANKIFDESVEKLGEKEALSLTKQYAKNFFKQGFYGGGTEVFENKLNDGFASMTYDPKRKVLTINGRDIESFAAGFIGEGTGSVVGTTIENKYEPEYVEGSEKLTPEKVQQALDDKQNGVEKQKNQPQETAVKPVESVAPSVALKPNIKLSDNEQKYLSAFTSPNAQLTIDEITEKSGLSLPEYSDTHDELVKKGVIALSSKVDENGEAKKILNPDVVEAEVKTEPVKSENGIPKTPKNTSTPVAIKSSELITNDDQRQFADRHRAEASKLSDEDLQKEIEDINSQKGLTSYGNIKKIILEEELSNRQLNETAPVEVSSPVESKEVLSEAKVSEVEKVEVSSEPSRSKARSVLIRKKVKENLTTGTVKPSEQIAETPKAKVIEVANTGNKLNVFTERGTKANIQPKVVDSSDLLTSLDEGYPSEFQPRDRSRQSSKTQISEIANKLNPEFLGDSPKASDGRPLVVPVQMPDGSTKYAVISGNGRTQGIREAYNLGKADSYVNFAKSKDEKSAAKQPVYVGVLDSKGIDLAEFAKEANESATAQMSATEQAKADADRLDNNVMSQFVASDDGSIHGAANRDFIRSFMARAVGTAEQNRFLTADGTLNQDGVNRVRNAIFAKAFGDSETGLNAIARMSESTDNNVKNITSALLAKAPQIAELKELVKSGNRYKEIDIATDLSVAMEKYSSLRDSNTSVDDFIKQGNLFGAETTPLQTRIIEVFDKHKRSPKAIRGIIDNFLSASEAFGNPNQINLFGESEPISVESIFEGAIKAYERGITSESQTSLFDQNQGLQPKSEARQTSNDDAQSANQKTEELKPLRKIADRETTENLRYQKNLNNTENVLDLLPDVVSKVDGDMVKLSLEAGEFVRSASAVVNNSDINSEPNIAGQFLNPDEITRYKSALSEFAEVAKEEGKDAQPIIDLIKSIDEASSENGTVIFNVYDDAIRHERFHQIGYLSANEYDKTLVNRVKDFKNFVKNNKPFLQKVHDNFFSRHGYSGKAQLDVIVEETAAYIATGDYDMLGIDVNDDAQMREAHDYLYNWFEAYEQQHGNLARFEKFFNETEKAAEIIKGLKDAKEKTEKVGDRLQESEIESGQRGTEKSEVSPVDDGESKGENRRLPDERTEKERISKTPQTLRENGIPLDDRFYTGVTNLEQQDFANKQLDKGVESAEKWLNEQVSDNNYNQGSTTAVALSLMNHYGKTGDIKALNSVADKIVPMLTEAGQAIQAMSLVSVHDPKTAGSYAAKVKKQKTGKDLSQAEMDKAVALAMTLSETAKADGVSKALLEKANKAVEDLQEENKSLAETAKILANSNSKISIKLSDFSKSIRNLKAQVKRLQDSKPRHSNKPVNRVKQELESEKADLEKLLSDAFGDKPLKLVAKNAPLRKIAPEILNEAQEDALVKLTALDIINGKTYDETIKGIETRTKGSLTPEDVQAVHAEADAMVRGKRELTDEQKEALKIRNEHHRKADQFSNRNDIEIERLLKEQSKRLREQEKEAAKASEAENRSQGQKNIERLKKFIADKQEQIKNAKKAEKQALLEAERLAKKELLQAERDEREAIRNSEREANQAVKEFERDAKKADKEIKPLDKFTDFVIRIGVENNYSDEAIFTALARKTAPEDLTKRIKQEFPDLSNTQIRQALKDADEIYQKAKSEIKRYRIMVNEQVKVGEKAITRIEEERRVNNRDKQKATREASSFYDALSKSTGQVVTETAVNYRKANLLSAIKTHLKNITGNIGFAVSEEAERFVGSAADILASFATHQRSMQGISLKGVAQGFKNVFYTDDTLKNLDKESGIKTAYKIIRYGDSVDNLSKQQLMESNLKEKFNFLKTGSIMDGYVNFVFRTLSAEDALFKVYAFRRSLEEQAKIMAKNGQGEYKKLITNPTNVMQEFARQSADFATFQNDNKISQFISKAKGNVPYGLKAVFEILVPFDKTPTNIVLRVLEHTPYGLAKSGVELYKLAKRRDKDTQKVNADFRSAVVKDLTNEDFEKLPLARQRKLIEQELNRIFTQKQQREFASTFARGATGTFGLVPLGYILAMLGMMSGAMSMDSEDKEEKEEAFDRLKEGVDPGSIKIGSVRFKLPDTPMAKAMLFGATLYEQQKMAKKGKKDALGAVMDGVSEATSDAVFEQPLLKQTKELFTKNQNLGGFTGNILSGFIPASAMIRSISEVTDPEQRKKFGYTNKEAKGKSTFDVQRTAFQRQFFGGIPVAREFTNPVTKTAVPKNERGGWLRRLAREVDPFNFRSSDMAENEFLDSVEDFEKQKTEGKVKDVSKAIQDKIKRAEKLFAEKKISKATLERIRNLK